jgi:alpha-tubulin suppressor-like RCC1 family protein
MKRAMVRMLATLLLCLSASAAAAATPQVVAGSQVLWLQGDGTVWASGDAEPSRGDADARPRKTFKRIEGLSRVVSLAINHDSSDSAAAIDVDGALWLWGELAEFACTTETCKMPAHQPRRFEALGPVRAVALGRQHLIAIGRDGKLRSVGSNELGQLGSGPLRNESRMQARLPRVIDTIPDAVDIAAQGDTSLVLRADGSVWGMGSARWGLLGAEGRWRPLDFSDPPHAQPMRIAGLDGIRSISLGRFHGLALDANGDVWGWGVNESAQLASPAVELIASPPRRIAGLADAAAIAAGDDYTLVLKRDGSVWARGGNVYGTLGDGGDELDGDLRRITALDGKEVEAVFAGDYNAFARTRDGRVLGWGTNGATVGGFDAGNADDGTLLPVVLDRHRQPPAPSAAVQAGAAAFAFAAELDSDETRERSELWIAGSKVAALDLDRSTPRSNRGSVALELAPGVHAYELRGEAQMQSGETRALRGRGAIVVTRDGIEAQFRANVATLGLLEGYRRAIGLVRAVAPLDARADLRSAPPPSAESLDAFEKTLGRRLPRAYRDALRTTGSFVIGVPGERYPAVALYSPAQLASLDDWIARALRNVAELDKTDVSLSLRDRDMLDRFRLYAAEIEPARQRLAVPWKRERIAALLPEAIYLIVPDHPTACEGRRAHQRIVDFFDVQQDEDSGEERYFAWADSADCEIDLGAALAQAVFEHYTAALRANGVVFVRAAGESDERPFVTPERLESGEDGELSMRLSGGEAVAE